MASHLDLDFKGFAYVLRRRNSEERVWELCQEGCECVNPYDFE